MCIRDRTYVDLICRIIHSALRVVVVVDDDDDDDDDGDDDDDDGDDDDDDDIDGDNDEYDLQGFMKHCLYAHQGPTL